MAQTIRPGLIQPNALTGFIAVDPGATSEEIARALETVNAEIARATSRNVRAMLAGTRAALSRALASRH